MKIQKMVSLDAETARLASMKSNFSDWVRSQLRSERNQRDGGDFTSMKLEQRRQMEELNSLWNLNQRKSCLLLCKR